MTDREKRVRTDAPTTDELDDVEGHGRWNLPGDEQPSSGTPGAATAAPDREDRA